ncbi:MAG: UPF0262 family protein [Hyphomicrobiaceae bacterium]
MSDRNDYDPSSPTRPAARLVAISLDPASIARSNRHAEHEREVAIYDLIDANSFALVGRNDGPYKLRLGIVEDRLAFDISSEADEPLVTHLLSLTPLKRIIKDYFIVCDSYYQAIRSAPPSRIQAIDMGRRGLHDEGSRLLTERLAGKVEIDHDTARRLFTLVCALHWKG